MAADFLCAAESKGEFSACLTTFEVEILQKSLINGMTIWHPCLSIFICVNPKADAPKGGEVWNSAEDSELVALGSLLRYHHHDE